jgi:hypothetical protein
MLHLFDYVLMAEGQSRVATIDVREFAQGMPAGLLAVLHIIIRHPRNRATHAGVGNSFACSLTCSQLTVSIMTSQDQNDTNPSGQT